MWIFGVCWFVWFGWSFIHEPCVNLLCGISSFKQIFKQISAHIIPGIQNILVILLMEEIRLTSWYGSLSHYLQGFKNIPGGWEWDFRTINSITCWKLRAAKVRTDVVEKHLAEMLRRCEVFWLGLTWCKCARVDQLPLFPYNRGWSSTLFRRGL